MWHSRSKTQTMPSRVTCSQTLVHGRDHQTAVAAKREAPVDLIGVEPVVPDPLDGGWVVCPLDRELPDGVARDGWLAQDHRSPNSRGNVVLWHLCQRLVPRVTVVGRVLKVAGWAIINRTCRQAFGVAHTGGTNDGQDRCADQLSLPSR
jgi:hypothetical protein